MEIVSIREFGRRVGLSEGAIRKAIKSFKIAKTSVRKNKKNGRPEIRFETAYEDCRLNGVGADHGIELPPLFTLSKENKKIKTEEEPETEKKITTASPPPQPQGNSLIDAKRRRAVYEAELKGLELAEIKKILVRRDKVFEELFAFGSEIKSSLEAIPDKYIDLIFAAKDRHEASLILTKGIAESLESLARMGDLKI
jgi:hypothetical protein